MRTSIKAITASALIGILLLAAIAWAGGLYQESTVSTEITTYRRMATQVIDNTINQVPSATFTTEVATLIPGQAPTTKFLRRNVLRLDDPKRIVPLYNPSTGERIGQITAEYVYVINYSLWRLSEDEADAPAMQGTN